MTGPTPAPENGESGKIGPVDFDDPIYLHHSDNIVTTIINLNFLELKILGFGGAL